MRSSLVVILSPCFNRSGGIVQGQKHVLVYPATPSICTAADPPTVSMREKPCAAGFSSAYRPSRKPRQQAGFFVPIGQTRDTENASGIGLPPQATDSISRQPNLRNILKKLFNQQIFAQLEKSKIFFPWGHRKAVTCVIKPFFSNIGSDIKVIWLRFPSVTLF